MTVIGSTSSSTSTGGYSPTGPTTLTGLVTLTIAGAQREYKRVKSNSGLVTMSASPQIESGTIVGQELLLHGTNNTDIIKFVNGLGLAINGSCVLRQYSSLYLIWGGSVWVEICRNDI